MAPSHREYCRYADAVFPQSWRAQMAPNGAEPVKCSLQASQSQKRQLFSFCAQFKLDSNARCEALAGFFMAACTEGLPPTVLTGDNGLPAFGSSDADFLDRRGGVTIMVMRLPVEKAGPPSSAAAS